MLKRREEKEEKRSSIYCFNAQKSIIRGFGSMVKKLPNRNSTSLLKFNEICIFTEKFTKSLVNEYNFVINLVK